MLLNLAESTLFEREAITLNLFSKQLPRPLDFTFHIWTRMEETILSTSFPLFNVNSLEDYCGVTRDLQMSQHSIKTLITLKGFLTSRQFFVYQNQQNDLLLFHQYLNG